VMVIDPAGCDESSVQPLKPYAGRVGERRPLRADPEAVTRAIVAVTSPKLSDDLVSALSSLRYEVRSVATATDVFDQVDDDHDVTVVVDDHHDDWLAIVSDLVATRPGVRPVVLAAGLEPEEFFGALSAGVVGFCAPDADLDAIVRTIESVRTSGVSIPRGMVGPLVDEVRHGRGHRVHTVAGDVEVTDREWDVLLLLLKRRSTREMADALYVSTGTVRSHICVLLKKLGAVDREDAISLIERGRRSGARGQRV